ncbi:MAG TPA: ChaN family lipoprotein [Patescibacteria group bacterium]
MSEAPKFYTEETSIDDLLKSVPADTKVLSLCEGHTSQATKREVAECMEELGRLGFTHLAMEAFGIDAQEALNEYQESSTNKGRKGLLKYLKRGLGGWLTKGPELYMGIVDAAIKNGIKVRGIALPQKEESKFSGVFELRDLLDRKDIHMAGAVASILNENPSNRVITFTGTNHVIYGKSMGGYLRESKIDTFNVVFLGKDYPTEELTKRKGNLLYDCVIQLSEK